MYIFPAEVEQSITVPSCVSSQTINKCTPSSLLYAMLSAFLCFLVLILLFKMAPKHSAEALSQVPRCTVSITCLTGNLCVKVDRLSGRCYSAVGHGFNVNDSTTNSK